MDRRLLIFVFGDVVVFTQGLWVRYKLTYKITETNVSVEIVKLC